ncbi:DMT family transporter [Brucella intermedia]|nr:DMT family transporter [Brucella intermedia]
MNSISLGTILALGSGLSMACYVILVKQVTRSGTRASAVALTFQTHFTAFVVATPLMFSLWHYLTNEQWTMAISLTLIGLVGQYLIINAYRYGEASFVAPIAYTEIITSTIASWYFFKQVPDIITFVGVAILIGSSIYLAKQYTPRKIS